ncbi:MAG: sugar ABC transporter substrate-binding protein [Arthrobacter sp.]|nr:sugar ABC transporter substrate-binding protein [Arthrobacter sp.]
MTIKRKVLGIAAITMSASLFLSACSTSGDSSGAPSTSTPNQPVKKVLFDYPFTALPVYSLVTKFAQKRADQAGVQLELTNDNMDLGQQVTNLNTYLTSNVDAVVSFPADAASLESVSKQYVDKGKYWVSYGGDLSNQHASIKFSFYESGKTLGEYAGKWANENLGGKGEVLMIVDQTIQLGRERTKGLLDGFKATAPGMTIVAEQQGITPDQGLSVTNAIVARHPKLNMVLAAAGDAAQGGYQALTTAGRAANDPKTFVGGLDGNEYVLQQIKAGTFFRAAVTVDAEQIGNAIIDVPLALAKGNGSKASLDLPVTLVDASSPKLDALIAQLGGK